MKACHVANLHLILNAEGFAGRNIGSDISEKTRLNRVQSNDTCHHPLLDSTDE